MKNYDVQNYETNEVKNDVEGGRKKRPKKIIIAICVVLLLAVAAGGKDDKKVDSSTAEANADNSNTESDMTSVSHIYDNAEIKDVMNGVRTDKIGEYSVIKIPSSEVTPEALEDWYFNYVETHDYNWCMIIYTDSDELKGVYANNGTVEKDTYFNKDEYGDYSAGDNSNSIVYLPENGKLVETK